MKRLSMSIALFFVPLLLSACETGPHPKMGAYLQSGNIAQPSSSLKREAPSAFRVGLVVVNDLTEKKSAPPLSRDVVLALTQNIKSQMEKGFPIEVVQVVPFDEKGSMALGNL